MSEPSTAGEMSAGISEYEFSREHNLVMSSLSGAIVMVSIATILLSSVNILLGLGHATQHGTSSMFEVLGGIIGLLIGLWLMNAAHAFDQVVKTQGTDITHLMGAMRQLRRVFQRQAILMGVQAALIMIVLVMSLKT